MLAGLWGNAELKGGGAVRGAFVASCF